MQLIKRLYIQSLLAVVLLPGAVSAADDLSKVPKDEAKAALSGKTLTFTAANGATVRVAYQDNGSLTARSGGVGGNNIESSGGWTIDEEGKICQKIRKGPLPDRCYFLMRAGDNYSLSPDGSARGTPVRVE